MQKVHFNNIAKLNVDILKGQTLTASVVGQVVNESETNMQNVVKVSTKGIEPVQANVITYNLITTNPNSSNNGNSNSSNNQENLYKITGTAWVDANKNGEMERSEEKLSNLEVIALNKNTNEVYYETTKNDGTYVFENLENGNYIVLFKYNNQKYSITQSYKEGITDVLNSKAIQATANIDGKQVVVGAVDEVNIANSNINNINIGLYENSIFDLRLDKYIENIKVTDKKETKNYSYNEAKFSKIELNSKYADDVYIEVDYKLKITNEGDIAGYVGNLVDYLPTGWNYENSRNNGWYLEKDGNLNNDTLEGKEIKPGESTEVKLTISRRINGEETGILQNTAEIGKSYNGSGIKDKDSICLNNMQNEDDFSIANIVIGIKTGKVALYICLTLSMMITLGVGIYFIKREVLI